MFFKKVGVAAGRVLLLMLTLDLCSCGGPNDSNPSSEDPRTIGAQNGSRFTNVSKGCDSYVDSEVYRPRKNQVTVGPSDDWVRAIEKAALDTEVLLKDGTYFLKDRYTVYVGSEVTIRGLSGNREDVLIQGRGYAYGSEGLTLTGKNTTIADLSITGVRDHALSIKGELGASAPHVYNVHLYDVGTQHIKLTPGGAANGLIACSSIGYTAGGVKGDYINAIDLHQAIDWTIRDNTIYNITGDGSGCDVDRDCGSYVSGPAILVWNNSRGTLIERNVILNSYRNIALGLERNHQGGSIRNNFIYRPEKGDAGIELNTATDTQVYNNTVIIGGYRGAIDLRRSTGLDIANNLISAPIWDREGGNQFQSRGNMVNATDADLEAPYNPHLSSTSLAIGAGVALSFPLDDIDGELRGARMDVGADSWSGD